MLKRVTTELDRRIPPTYPLGSFREEAEQPALGDGWALRQRC